MTGKEARGMKDEVITDELARLRALVYTRRVQGVTEKVEDNQGGRKIRRDIARLLTEQTARRQASRA